MDKDADRVGAIVTDTTPSPAPGTGPWIGKYVRVEALTKAHSAPLYPTFGAHDDIWTYVADGPFASEAEFVTELDKFNEFSGIALYTVFLDDEPVGVLNLGPYDLGSRVMEAGLMYGPRLQRTRTATEAFYLLLRHAFDDCRCRRVEWKTNSHNARSARAAERFGFTREGLLRNHRIVKGRSRDSLWYGMIESEWPPVKRAFELWLDEANFDEHGNQRRRLEEIRHSLPKEA